MVNKKGGKKHKRGKNHNNGSKAIRYKDEKENQEYAQIKNCKGNCRFDVLCFDGIERSAILCGGMRKRRFVKAHDIVLVSLRDFQDNVCDIIDSYDESQARKLQSNGLFPDAIKFQEENEFNETEDLGIDFGDTISDDEYEGDMKQELHGKQPEGKASHVDVLNSDVINFDEI
jgi:translation initiation factor 1A